MCYVPKQKKQIKPFRVFLWFFTLSLETSVKNWYDRISTSHFPPKSLPLATADHMTGGKQVQFSYGKEVRVRGVGGYSNSPYNLPQRVYARENVLVQRSTQLFQLFHHGIVPPPFYQTVFSVQWNILSHLSRCMGDVTNRNSAGSKFDRVNFFNWGISNRKKLRSFSGEDFFP